MAKQKTDLVAQKEESRQISVPADAPAFMQDDQMMGTEVVSKKIKPPYLKIIQKQSSDELVDEFGKGSAILAPDRILILTADSDPVRIVPVFFFVEYLKMAPIVLKDVEPMIVERSFDPTSEVARRATDRRLWTEKHPNHPDDPTYIYK